MSTGVLDTGPLDTGPLDTGPLDDAGTPSARAAVTPREAWRKAKVPLVLALFIVVVAVLRSLSTGAVDVDRMDPEAAGPEGGRALAALLHDHGVEVRTVDQPSGAAGVTVFVPVPRLVNAARPEALGAAAGAGDVVVAEAGDAHLAALDVPASVAGLVDERVVEPGCTQPDAAVAGPVRLGGVTYTGRSDQVTCYAAGGSASFLDIRGEARHVTVVGSAAFMTNEYLGEDGNAALALRLLTRQRTVEWVYPREPLAEDGEGEDVLSLVSDRVWLAVAEVLVAVLLLALWRGRRLGPVVPESLPVVVRAAEAVEGRARLYESAGSRERAAAALRAGLRDRLVRSLGLAADAGRETLVAAVSSRTSLDGPAVDALLYGPPPADDAGLVALADGLDSLDSEVRAQ